MVYEQCQIHPGMRILELGCGDGVLWTQNISSSPVKFPLLFLTFHPECFVMPDVLSDAKTAVFPSRHLTVQEFLMKTEALIWSLQTIVLFYCEDISAVCSEIQRVLTPGGKLICSTYGKNNMQSTADSDVRTLTTGSSRRR